MNPNDPNEDIIRRANEGRLLTEATKSERGAGDIGTPTTVPGGDENVVAEGLRENGYHPVILFGTRASGKSSLLVSLFNYVRASQQARAGIQIGDPIIPTHTEYGKSIYNDAQDLFHREVFRFNNHAAPRSTRSEYPFYVPVVLTPSDGLPEVKLAFLESRGEWYQPRVDRPEVYQDLRPEIAAVFTQFPESISLIHVAPSSTRDLHLSNGSPTPPGEEKEADAGLAGAIHAYQRIRNNRQLDRHLFLLSKWDVKTDGVLNQEFSRPSADVVRESLQQRYGQSWTAFCHAAVQSFALGSFMPYSVGPIQGENVLPLRSEDYPVLYRYPRTLLNWLYGNATANSRESGQVLYSDVMPPPFRPPTWLDRLMKVVGVR